MIRIGIVDDEQLAVARLKRMLNFEDVIVAAEGGSGQQALDIAKNSVVDILFLDIEMPGMSGLEVAKSIGELETTPPMIIFCTAYDEFAVDAFKTEAIGYLLKPYSAADLAVVLDKARAHLKHLPAEATQKEEQSKDLVIKSNDQIIKLDYDSIVYFFSSEKNTYAKLVDGSEVFVAVTLKELESKGKSKFQRIHRSFLIHKKKIKCIRKTDSGSWVAEFDYIPDILVISRRHLAEVKACLSEY